MRKKVLITGIMGQDGAYLAKFLLSKKYKVKKVCGIELSWEIKRIGTK